MDKKFWAIVGVIILVFVGFLVLRNDGTDTSTASSSEPTNHVIGNGTKVTLVEYGDFQCPACSGYAPVMKQVIEKYGNDITLQFRHFPIISLHPNAFAASRAAEAASKQDKFWEMYELIYANQEAWSLSKNPNSFFESYANQLGLDLETYQEDFLSNAVNDAIRADMAEARELNVSATPTFFVNGEAIETPPQSIDAFSEILDKAIADSQTE